MSSSIKVEDQKLLKDIREKIGYCLQIVQELEENLSKEDNDPQELQMRLNESLQAIHEISNKYSDKVLYPNDPNMIRLLCSQVSL